MPDDERTPIFFFGTVKTSPAKVNKFQKLTKETQGEGRNYDMTAKSLVELAQARAAEKQIDLDRALEEVAAEHPELLREWAPGQAAARISKQLGLK